ncbi:MAG: hypothetical protein ACXAEU_10590 [Candidatus Hodarchaeales archaeon]|jgi:predicted nucleotidyltransferase
MTDYEEYENLKTDVVTLIEDELRLYVRGLILYGSYQKQKSSQADNIFIPGDSDLDLVLIVDTGHITSPAKPYRRLAKISEVLNPIFFEPLYASIFDLTLVEMMDLPSSPCDLFNPIQSYEASKGKVLYGKSNILQAYEFSDNTLRNSAAIQIHSLYESLRTAFFRRSFIGDQELLFLGADTVLEMAHYLLAFKQLFGYVRLEVPDKFSEVFSGIMDEKMNECIKNSMKIRLGQQNQINKKNFILRALRFAKRANNYCREPF